MTVRQLLANLDSRELSEWTAFYKLENAEIEEKRNTKAGQIKTKDPDTLSEALKAQLAPKKAGAK